MSNINKTIQIRIIILIALFTVGCGGYNVTQSGESVTKVTINFGFLDQVKQLCYDYVGDNFPTLKAKDQAVAKCVFDNMKALGQVKTPGEYCSVDNKLSDPIIADFCSQIGK